MPLTVAKRALALLAAFVAGAAAYAYLPALLQTGTGEPPMNLVAISDRLHTSGQPSRTQLSALHADGYALVINLAPPGSAGSIADEGARVAGGGAMYVNIPVDWQRPSARDFEAFAALLDAHRDRRVLVHCQVNKRASVFTFLYRVVRDGVPVDEAIEAVHRIWVPGEQWEAFMRATLDAHGVAFEPGLLP